jgi:hypothetical protein
MRQIHVCLLCSVMMGAAASAAAGVLQSIAPNNVFISTAVTAAFVGSAGTVLSAQDSKTGIASTPGAEGYVNTVARSVSQSPFSGVGSAEGTMSVTFNVGDGPAADNFMFSMNGVASATSAMAADGETASARVSLVGSFEFYVDAAYSGLPAGTVVGQLSFAALRAADPGEVFSLTVKRNGTDEIFIQSAGGAAGLVDLAVGQAYRSTFTYEITVPFGVDPPFALSSAGVIVPAAPALVPEPGSAVLMLLGLVGLMQLGRRPAGFSQGIGREPLSRS